MAFSAGAQFVDIPIPAAQKLITTLHRAGCPVLWLYPANLPCRTVADTTTIAVEDPLDAVEHIADAAVIALSQS